MLIQAQPTQSFAVSTVESQGHTINHHGYVTGQVVGNTGGFYGNGGGHYGGGVGNGVGHYGQVGLMEQHRNIVTCSSTTMNGSILSLPKSWTPSQETNEDMLVNVYRFVKSFVGSTGSGQGTIDNRIEQAMDLVKSHLMSAVRSEVEELRDKITKLEESVTVLSRENEYLRANVNQDVLASLSGARPHQPPDPNHQ